MSEKLTQPGKQERESTQESKESKEQLEKLRSDIEKRAEKQPDSKEAKETARKSIEKEAVFGKEFAPDRGEKKSQRPYIAKEDKARSFSSTMKRTQKQMGPTSRTFSKFIHQPIIEKSSEVVGKTIARPSAILGGAITAFVGVTYIFFTAKNVGFALSGSETIYLLAVGWALGLVTEFVYKGIRRVIS